MELAQEMLEITSEAELEEFLGKLVQPSRPGRQLLHEVRRRQGDRRVLRNVAKTALPMVGSALGSFVAPGIGTAIGGQARLDGLQAPRGRGARDDGRGRGRVRSRPPLRPLGRRHRPQRPCAHRTACHRAPSPARRPCRRPAAMRRPCCGPGHGRPDLAVARRRRAPRRRYAGYPRYGYGPAAVRPTGPCTWGRQAKATKTSKVAARGRR